MPASVVIAGQRFPQSDASLFVIAVDLLRGLEDDINMSLVEPAGEVQRDREETARFGPIVPIVRSLRARFGHHETLAWLVTPLLELDNARPLHEIAQRKGRRVRQPRPHTPTLAWVGFVWRRDELLDRRSAPRGRAVR